jgi:KipI family sensor histidine kinase inhibitor
MAQAAAQARVPVLLCAARRWREMTNMASELVKFLPGSDQTLMVYFGDSITLEAHECVVRFLRLMEGEPIAGVRNLHPGYCSMLVKFDALRWTHCELEIVLRGYLGRLESVALGAARGVEIPVCYGGEFGPDLGDVCAARGLTAERAIELHTSVSYLVYFLGFVPGFAYLGEIGGEDGGKAGGMHSALQELSMPRLATPRRSVPAGSVGIAGEQTGVYPFATPGGWRLIGRTPVKMFRAETAESVLAIGDRVRFVAISAERFAETETA